nr:hypothetical protein [Pseudonocardia sp. ICBG601]
MQVPASSMFPAAATTSTPARSASSTASRSAPPAESTCADGTHTTSDTLTTLAPSATARSIAAARVRISPAGRSAPSVPRTANRPEDWRSDRIRAPGAMPAPSPVTGSAAPARSSATSEPWPSQSVRPSPPVR